MIGICSGLAEVHQAFGPQARLFLVIGFLGGFTTFSAFGHETLALAGDTQTYPAITNVALHLFLGLTAVWLGQNLTRF